MSPIMSYQVSQARLPTPATTDPIHSAFPIASLPPPFRGYAQQGAIAVGVAVEMVAVPLIVAAGATIGRQRILRLKPDFQQLPVLFAGVVAPPGSAKSPALSTALRPLKYLQHLAVQRYRQAQQQA